MAYEGAFDGKPKAWKIEYAFEFECALAEEVRKTWAHCRSSYGDGHLVVVADSAEEAIKKARDYVLGMEDGKQERYLDFQLESMERIFGRVVT